MIDSVVATEQGGGPLDGEFDAKVIPEGVEAGGLEGAIEGLYIIGVKRVGKLLWLELSESHQHWATPCSTLLMSFGMAGVLVFQGAADMHDTPVGSAWPPSHTKLELELEHPNGQKLRMAYIDTRRMGRILLRGAAPEKTAPLKRLATDPLGSKFDKRDFANKLLGSHMPVKTMLLDQSRVVCGLGSWVADEVLYHAKINPTALCNTLSDDQLEHLYHALMHVLELSCSCRTAHQPLPHEWLFHVRTWGKKDGIVSTARGQVVYMSIHGRATAYLPDRQFEGKRPKGAPPYFSGPANWTPDSYDATEFDDAPGELFPAPNEAPSRSKVGARSRGRRLEEGGEHGGEHSGEGATQTMVIPSLERCCTQIAFSFESTGDGEAAANVWKRALHGVAQQGASGSCWEKFDEEATCVGNDDSSIGEAQQPAFGATDGGRRQCAEEQEQRGRRLSQRRLEAPDGCTDAAGQKVACPGGEVQAAEWYQEWNARLECWWASLPMPTQGHLSACMGALALHISSRFNIASRGAGTGAAAPEPGCEEWLGKRADELRLPSFPSLGEFDFVLPPIPRLMPHWLQLQAFGDQKKHELSNLKDRVFPDFFPWHSSSNMDTGSHSNSNVDQGSIQGRSNHENIQRHSTHSDNANLQSNSMTGRVSSGLAIGAGVGSALVFAAALKLRCARSGAIRSRRVQVRRTVRPSAQASQTKQAEVVHGAG